MLRYIFVLIAALTWSACAQAKPNWSKPGWKWIIAGVSDNFDGAKLYARALMPDFPSVAIFRKPNKKFYAITIGSAPTAKVAGDISNLVARGAIPSGSYPTAGDEFDAFMEMQHNKADTTIYREYHPDAARKREYKENMAKLLSWWAAQAIAGDVGGGATRGDDLDMQERRAKTFQNAPSQVQPAPSPPPISPFYGDGHLYGNR